MTVQSHRINGELMSQHIGHKIILLGSIISVSANGTNLELRTSDSMLVNVILSTPVDGNITGYVEVHGVAKSKTTVTCTNLIQFSPEITSKFELDQYNELIVLSNTLGPNKWKMSKLNAIAQAVKL